MEGPGWFFRPVKHSAYELHISAADIKREFSKLKECLSRHGHSVVTLFLGLRDERPTSSRMLLDLRSFERSHSPPPDTGSEETIGDLTVLAETLAVLANVRTLDIRNLADFEEALNDLAAAFGKFERLERLSLSLGEMQNSKIWAALEPAFSRFQSLQELTISRAILREAADVVELARAMKHLSALQTLRFEHYYAANEMQKGRIASELASALAQLSSLQTLDFSATHYADSRLIEELTRRVPGSPPTRLQQMTALRCLVLPNQQSFPDKTLMEALRQLIKIIETMRANGLPTISLKGSGIALGRGW